MRNRYLYILSSAVLLTFYTMVLTAGEPNPTPKNTITLKKCEPVKPLAFERPLKFFVDKSLDRSGAPRPMMVWERKGGLFLDREPAIIVREAVEDSLQAADMRATDATTADYILDVYVFHFGLAESSGLESFGKVDLGFILKNLKSGKSQNLAAMGTAIGKRGSNKEKMKATLEEALQDALRNFFRGTKLRDAISSFESTAQVQ
jgi:hypothetical protein